MPKGALVKEEFIVCGIKIDRPDELALHVWALLRPGEERPDMNRSTPNSHGTIYTYKSSIIKGMIGEIFKEMDKVPAEDKWKEYDPKSHLRQWRDPVLTRTKMLNTQIRKDIEKYFRRSSDLYARLIQAHPEMALPEKTDLERAREEKARLLRAERNKALPEKERRARNPQVELELPPSGDLNPVLEPPAQPPYDQYDEQQLSHTQYSSVHGITAGLNETSLKPTAGSSMRAIQPKTPVAPPAQSKSPPSSLPSGATKKRRGRPPNPVAPPAQSRQQITRRSSTPPDSPAASPPSWDPNLYRQPPAQPRHNTRHDPHEYGYTPQPLSHSGGSQSHSGHFAPPPPGTVDPRQLFNPSGSYQYQAGPPVTASYPHQQTTTEDEERARKRKAEDDAREAEDEYRRQKEAKGKSGESKRGRRKPKGS